MTSEPISTAYFINPSHQSVSVCVSPIIGKSVTAATNTRTVELFDAFYMRSVSCQRNVSD
jgi:hypothetical protein